MCAYDLMLAAKDQQHEAIAYSAVLGSRQDLIWDLALAHLLRSLCEPVARTALRLLAKMAADLFFLASSLKTWINRPWVVRS